MIDFSFLAVYVIAAIYSRLAIVPLIAFSITLMIGATDMPTAVSHGVFSMVYLLLIPLSNIKIAWGMLASAIVNFFALAYFLSPIYLANFVLYFAFAMTVVNLYILFTIFRGVKNGKRSSLGDVVYFRVVNSCHNQASTATFKGRQ